MPPPAPGMVRVLARVNVGRLRAGRWHDLGPAELADLEEVGFVTRLDDYGRPAPDDIPQPCCTG